MRMIVLGALATAVAVTGCQKREEQGAGLQGSTRGRFVGVGLYTPGQMWPQISRPSASQDPASATLADDEEVIVVMDSATGEIRQCGNLSGHCLAFNPWSKTASVQGAPAPLLKHAQQLAAEAEAERARDALAVTVRQK